MGEPFGRTSLEASANGCAVIITNKGGLPETVTNGKILKKLLVNDLVKSINNLITDNKYRKKLNNYQLKILLNTWLCKNYR